MRNPVTIWHRIQALEKLANAAERRAQKTIGGWSADANAAHTERARKAASRLWAQADALRWVLGREGVNAAKEEEVR